MIWTYKIGSRIHTCEAIILGVWPKDNTALIEYELNGEYNNILVSLNDLRLA